MTIRFSAYFQNKMKTAILFAYFLFFLSGCKEKTGSVIKISGEAQGTTYSISWISNDGLNYQMSVDSIFKRIDSSLSTYLPVSIISRVNKNDSTVILDDHFITVFRKAGEVSEKTGGAFDVTVAPVINAWGFGFTKKATVDSAMIDSLLQFIGYGKVSLYGNRLVKGKKETMLDFNAIAQGYTVDVISNFLKSRGVENYFVELGGEVKTKGKKENNEYWKVGIDKPQESIPGERPLQAIIDLENKALATSGNYRKFYEENGQKYSHIIDPATGYPAKNNLLSASVLADDCMTADAYATAFMVMGLERSKKFLSENKNLKLEVYFIYDENGVLKTYVSDELKKLMTELD
jgi:thiamine biosynthesis lipoprotein